MLGAGRALILQVAHPLVGAGVEQYSRFHTNRWSRLTHTLDTMGQIIFGDERTARRGAERMRRAHARIQGVVSTGHAAGRSYDATDPALILWVWATLVDTSLLTYQRFVGRLAPDEIARYYEEQKRFAHACGVPPDDCPATHDDFAAYFAEIVATTLEPTQAARHVAEMALNPLRLPRLAAPLLAALSLPTLGLLPAKLRIELELPWSRTRHAGLALASIATRACLPLLPTSLRRVRSAREASARVHGGKEAFEATTCNRGFPPTRLRPRRPRIRLRSNVPDASRAFRRQPPPPLP
jgi:uncharacterized protein (DUF2236 family)